jgi:hypothetical protein
MVVLPKHVEDNTIVQFKSFRDLNLALEWLWVHRNTARSLPTRPSWTSVTSGIELSSWVHCWWTYVMNPKVPEFWILPANDYDYIEIQPGISPHGLLESVWQAVSSWVVGIIVGELCGESKSSRILNVAREWLWLHRNTARCLPTHPSWISVTSGVDLSGYVSCWRTYFHCCVSVSLRFCDGWARK